MALKRAFISFDYDHDQALKELLVGQSKHPDTPFAIADHSIKEASSTWKAEARKRIKGCDVVIVLCGQNTDTASGVSTEISIAKEEGVDFFLLAGYSDGRCKLPKAASNSRLYKWTWENLKNLVGGSR